MWHHSGLIKNGVPRGNLRVEQQKLNFHEAHIHPSSCLKYKLLKAFLSLSSLFFAKKSRRRFFKIGGQNHELFWITKMLIFFCQKCNFFWFFWQCFWSFPHIKVAEVLSRFLQLFGKKHQSCPKLFCALFFLYLNHHFPFGKQKLKNKVLVNRKTVYLIFCKKVFAEDCHQQLSFTQSCHTNKDEMRP